MAFNKRTWLGRQGTGLNKFSIGGATPVTIVNQPDSVTQVGDALSAGNLNDLEDRIEDAFDDVDTELATKADEQDVTNLNNAITALDHRLENIEQSKGDYIVSSYKDGSITPSGKGNWAVVEGVRGVSRVENQLIEEMNSTNFTLNYATGSFSDGVCTFTASAYRGTLAMSHRTLPSEAGHTILISVKIKTTTATTNVRLYTYGGNATLSCEATTNWQTLSRLVTTNASWGYDLANNNKATIEDTRNADWDAIQVKDFIATDLTLYFGGTIPSDADTIAKIQTNYPELLEPSDYGTRIVDWTGNGVRAWGVNLWDEVWQAGGLNISTGADDDTRMNRIRSENYIPVSQYKTYYYLDNSETWWAYFYDADKNFIGRNAVNGTTSFTPLAGAFFMRFETWNGYGNVYKNDVQICDNSLPDAVKQTYHPYMENTLSFPSISLKSAGSVRDTLELNVEVDGVAKKRETERTNSYTFTGNETWTYQSSSKLFYMSKPNGMANISSNSSVANITCQNFVTTSINGARADLGGADKTISQGYITASSQLCIRDDSKNGDTSALASSLTGLTFNFEKATYEETLSDPIIDNTLLTESGGRLSTVQTGTVVDGISDLGFITL